MANWQQHVADLEHVAADLSSRVSQCRRRQDQALTRTLLKRIYLAEAQEQEKRDKAVTLMRALIPLLVLDTTSDPKLDISMSASIWDDILGRI